MAALRADAVAEAERERASGVGVPEVVRKRVMACVRSCGEGVSRGSVWDRGGEGSGGRGKEGGREGGREMG